MITKQTAANKLADYLHHAISLEQLKPPWSQATLKNAMPPSYPPHLQGSASPTCAHSV